MNAQHLVIDIREPFIFTYASFVQFYTLYQMYIILCMLYNSTKYVIYVMLVSTILIWSALV